MVGWRLACGLEPNVPNPEDLKNWLALHNVVGLQPAVARALVQAFGTTTQVLAASDTLLAQAGLNPKQRAGIRNPDWAYVQTLLDWAQEPGQALLTPGSTAFPELLEAIPDPPIVLFVRGHIECLSKPQLAIVGSRNPTVNALDTAIEFACGLSRCGHTIISGLATGIDGAAHRGALKAGGQTIAVLGSGVDVIYPKSHRQLADDITQNGALVSEYLPGTSPKAMNFPRRNRIISGLSRGVLVVEAAARSGSLITARLALEQGREVFAIPGSIHNPLSKGCHRLIREGATLVENINDIQAELKGVEFSSVGNQKPQAEVREDLDEDYVTVLQAMGFDPASVDTLVERTSSPFIHAPHP